VKLRCTTNSIRIRLVKSDLEKLKSTLQINDQITFPNGESLIYSLAINNHNSIVSNVDNNHIEVSIPNTIANDWINSDKVSIENFLPLPDGKELHILIEKDFPCKDREEENKEDTFWELSDKDPKNC